MAEGKKYRQGKSKQSIEISEILASMGIMGLLFIIFTIIMYNLLK
jgi:hypothetical protein